VPALPPYLIEPIWQQFEALLPEHRTYHPLGCHCSRIPERVLFEKLVRVLIFGCAYERNCRGILFGEHVASQVGEWIELGMLERLSEICLDAYGHLIGPEPSEVAVDCCFTRHRRRRGEDREKPGGQGQTGHQALEGGGRFGHYT